MVDLKPPQLVAGELATVHDLLQFQRESLVRKVEGVSDEDARRSPVPSGTSLLWLMKHISRAERVWIFTRFVGSDAALPPNTVDADDTLAAAVAYYRQTWAEVDEVVAHAPGLDEVAKVAGGEDPVNLRWILMHLLEETARHAGHADILRELLDGSTGR